MNLLSDDEFLGGSASGGSTLLNDDQFMGGATAPAKPAETPAAPKKAEDWPSQQKVGELKLSPQEQHLYQHHIDNLNDGKFVRNDDGSVSTIYQTSVDIKGRTYNFPTVWDGKILDPQAAVERSINDGGLDSWPSYPSVDAAESRYQTMHGVMDDDIAALDERAAASKTADSKPQASGVLSDDEFLGGNPPAASGGFIDQVKKGFISGLVDQNPQMVGNAMDAIAELSDGPSPGDLVGRMVPAKPGGKVRPMEESPQRLRDLAAQVKEWGAQGAETRQPNVPSVTSIRTDSLSNMINDAADYAGYVIGSGAGTSAPSLAVGVAGAAVTKSPLGFIASAAGPSYVQNLGDTYGALLENEGVKKALADGKITRKQVASIAAGAAIPMAALDAASLEGVIGLNATGLKQNIVKRIIQRIGVGALTEGTTEGIQQVVQEAAIDFAGGDKTIAQQTVSVIDNAIGGALAGGAMSAGASPAAGHQAKEPGAAPVDQTTNIPQGAASADTLFGQESAGGTPPPSADTAAGGPPPPSAATTEIDRPNSPRLTAEDRASPLPNNLIDDGKAIFEAALSGGKKQPTTAEDVAPLDGQIITPAQQRDAAKRVADIAGEFGTPGSQAAMPALEHTIDGVATGTEAPSAPAASPVRELSDREFIDGISAIDDAAHVAATSPLNDRAEPTQAMKEAGNYAKGHTTVGGLDVSIENPQGSTRSGVDPSGKPWTQEMQSHYGYIKGTVGKDKDHLDVFIKPGTPPEMADSAPVFVVDQVTPNGKLDEHKVMMGFATQAEADAGYHANYQKGWKGAGAITPTTLAEFKGWLANGDTTKPFGTPQTAPQSEGKNATSPSEPSFLASVDRAAFDRAPQANRDVAMQLGSMIDQMRAAGNTERADKLQPKLDAILKAIMPSAANAATPTQPVRAGMKTTRAVTPDILKSVLNILKTEPTHSFDSAVDEAYHRKLGGKPRPAPAEETTQAKSEPDTAHIREAEKSLPSGYSFTTSTDGELAVRDAKGAVVARSAQQSRTSVDWLVGKARAHADHAASIEAKAKPSKQEALKAEMKAKAEKAAKPAPKAEPPVAEKAPKAKEDFTEDDIPAFLKKDRVKAALRRDITNTPAFKRWFGDSQVVDKNGDPLVVYHGSNRKIDEFKPSPGMRQEGGHQFEVTSPAYFFAEDRDTARMFAGNKVQIDRNLRGKSGGRPKVEAVYLSAQNPLDLTGGRFSGRVPDPEMATILGEAMGMIDDGPQTWEEVQQALDDPAVIDELRAQGFDGVRLKESDGSVAWAVFEPTQIKSVDNQGTFNPDDPRIRLKVADQIKPTDAFAAQAQDVGKRLRAELDRLGLKDIGLRISENLGLMVEGKFHAADGSYFQKLITIALDAEHPDATLQHEAVHALHALGLFGKDEWTILERMSRKKWMAEHKIADAYGSFSEAVQVEEGIAHAYDAWTRQASGFDGVIVKAFRKIKAVLRAISRAFGADFRSVDDVFASIQSGEIGNRPGVESKGEERFKLQDPQTAEDRQKTMQGFIARGQPLDRALRLPFEFLGGVDAKGRWKPGLYVTDKAAKIITTAKIDPEGRFGWLAGPVEAARAGLVDRYGLSPEYIERDRQRHMDERTITMRGAEVLKTLADQNVGPNEARVLQAILTGEAVSDKDMQGLAAPIRQAIDELGQEAVTLGLISAESFERNRGSYLHRVYAKHESEQNNLQKLVSQIMGSKRKKILGDTLKGRGLFWEVDIARLKQDGNVTQGEKYRVLDKVSAEDAGGKVTSRVYLPAGQEVPAKYAGKEWRDNGTWEARQIGKGKVTLWRDYSQAERSKMGEILDARYTIGKTYIHMAHDLAVGRFYKDIAENEDWATASEPAAKWVEADQRSRLVNDRETAWVKVPDTTISNTGGKKRWGALSGKWVRSEIWRDLNEIDIMNRPSTWRMLLSQWKLNKTSRSPVTHMNNVMSNLMLMDMNDVRMQDLQAGLRSFVKKDKHWQDANEHGVFGADMMTQEIRDNVLKPILDEMEKQGQDGTQNSFLARAGILGKFADRLWSLAKTADRKMIDLYRIEDDVFRLASYRAGVARGESAEHAAAAAREQFFDYDIRAPWVNAARNSLLPFISYTYRAVPLIARAMATKPWKLAKYAMVAYALNALAYAWDDDADEDKERASLRDEEQGKTWLGTYRMMRMPFRNADGLPVFLDTRRWIPGGDVFDTNQGSSALPIPAPLQFGGPLMLAFELALNKSGFTGDPITNDLTDTWFDKTSKVGDYLWKSWLPSAAWVPNSWYWTKIENAAKGATDIKGRPYSLPEAVASSFGIKLKPQDVETGIFWQYKDMKDVEQALRAEARTLARQRDRGLISQKAFDSGMQALLDKRDVLIEHVKELQRATRKK